MNYTEQNAKPALLQGQAGSIGPPVWTLRERLEQQKYNLEEQLKRVNEALSTMDANPQLEQFITTIQKAGGIHI